MLAQVLARRLSRAGVHYGWAIVAIVFLLALTTAGCMGISGALIVPLTKEFGWSTEQISVALALRIVLFGLMAPFTAALIADHHGWRVALAPPILALLLVAILIVMFLVDKPEDVGLKPYGDRGDTPAHVAPPAAFSRAFEILFESTRSPAFWVLAGTFFVCGLSTNGLVQTHFIALCGDYGMPAVAAASTLAMMGVFDFIGTVGSGWLSDRFDNRALLSMYYGFRGLSLIYLPSSTFTVYGLSLFAMFYGLDWIATVPPTVRLSAAHFGRERAGVVYGWVFASHMIGAAVAAWAGGFARSTFNTYLPAFYIAGFACLIAAGAVWLIGRTQSARERLIEARA
jgi:sugar phosphate permease